MPNADGLLDALEGASLTERGFRVYVRGLHPVLQTVPKDLKHAYDIAYSSATAVSLLATALEIIKTNRQYRALLRSQDREYEWGVITGTAYWRRLSRPEGEWRSLLDGR